MSYENQEKKQQGRNINQENKTSSTPISQRYADNRPETQTTAQLYAAIRANTIANRPSYMSAPNSPAQRKANPLLSQNRTSLPVQRKKQASSDFHLQMAKDEMAKPAVVQHFEVPPVNDDEDSLQMKNDSISLKEEISQNTTNLRPELSKDTAQLVSNTKKGIGIGAGIGGFVGAIGGFAGAGIGAGIGAIGGGIIGAMMGNGEEENQEEEEENQEEDTSIDTEKENFYRKKGILIQQVKEIEDISNDELNIFDKKLDEIEKNNNKNFKQKTNALESLKARTKNLRVALKDFNLKKKLLENLIKSTIELSLDTKKIFQEQLNEIKITTLKDSKGVNKEVEKIDTVAENFKNVKEQTVLFNTKKDAIEEEIKTAEYLKDRRPKFQEVLNDIILPEGGSVLKIKEAIKDLNSLNNQLIALNPSWHEVGPPVPIPPLEDRIRDKPDEDKLGIMYSKERENVNLSEKYPIWAGCKTGEKDGRRIRIPIVWGAEYQPADNHLDYGDAVLHTVYNAHGARPNRVKVKRSSTSNSEDEFFRLTSWHADINETWDNLDGGDWAHDSRNEE